MILKLLLIEILTVSAFVFVTNAANILAYFPVPSISHQVVFRPLTQELAKRGHQVTVITPDPAFQNGNIPPNIIEIDVHNKSYELWQKNVVTLTNGAWDNVIDSLKIALRKFIEIIEYQINTKEVIDIIKTKQYDLILLEACIEEALVMSHVFKAPFLQISSFGSAFFNDEAVGTSLHSIYYPQSHRKIIYNLSTWEKMEAVKEDFRLRNFLWSMEKNKMTMLENNFGLSIPTLTELQKNVEMLLLNINSIWEGNRPVTPNVIHLGGLHQQPIKGLPNDLKAFLDSSKHGVIYMSFGTNVDPDLLPSERIQIFCKVFSRLQYDVLWKWNSDDLPGMPKNVRISKWLPQPDLLRHKNIKLFITQAGLQSSDESIRAGVPLIAFPLAADQWYNAEKYVYHNIGIKMNFEELTEESLEESINKVIDDPSFRDNVKRLSILMRDQPQSPLERAVWWTEYVLRHGGAKHQRSPAANISWTEYLVLDVLLLFISILILGSLILICSIHFAYKIFRNVLLGKQKFKFV